MQAPMNFNPSIFNNMDPALFTQLLQQQNQAQVHEAAQVPLNPEGDDLFSGNPFCSQEEEAKQNPEEEESKQEIAKLPDIGFSEPANLGGGGADFFDDNPFDSPKTKQTV